MKKYLAILVFTLLPISAFAQSTGNRNIDTLSFNVISKSPANEKDVYITTEQTMINPANCSQTSYLLPVNANYDRELNMLQVASDVSVIFEISDSECSHDHPLITQLTLKWW